MNVLLSGVERHMNALPANGLGLGLGCTEKQRRRVVARADERARARALQMIAHLEPLPPGARHRERTPNEEARAWADDARAQHPPGFPEHRYAPADVVLMAAEAMAWEAGAYSRFARDARAAAIAHCIGK